MLLPPILDIEASGFGRGSYPIEIGFVDAEGACFCSLIRPEPDWLHWDPAAEALHGISLGLIEQHGRSPKGLAAEVNARLRGQTVYCDAWGYDYAWLNRLFDAADCTPQFRLDDLRKLLSEDEALRWHALTQATRERLAFRRHRASNDARVLHESLRTLRSPDFELSAG